MATVQDIFDRTEAELAKRFVASKPAAILQSQGYDFIKDAYDEIASECRLPRTSATQALTASTRAYNAPSGSYGRSLGIIDVDLETISDGMRKPLIKTTMQDLRGWYGDQWLNSDDYDGVIFWFIEDDTTKISVLGTPDASDASLRRLRIYHVVETAEPTTTADTIPTALLPFLRIIPLYVAGRCVGSKDGRGGNPLLQEFYAKLQLENAKLKRRGRLPIPDGKTVSITNYFNKYRGR